VTVSRRIGRAKIARAALMSKFKLKDDRPPVELSGRDDDGPLREGASARACLLSAGGR
jgi:hypothetical protein